MIDIGNAEEVIITLTMVVAMGVPENEQTANNFEAITHVIVNIREIVTRNISLQPLFNVCYMEQLTTFHLA